jgi:hypothetical protein
MRKLAYKGVSHVTIPTDMQADERSKRNKLEPIDHVKLADKVRELV